MSEIEKVGDVRLYLEVSGKENIYKLGMGQVTSQVSIFWRHN